MEWIRNKKNKLCAFSNNYFTYLNIVFITQCLHPQILLSLLGNCLNKNNNDMNIIWNDKKRQVSVMVVYNQNKANDKEIMSQCPPLARISRTKYNCM